jgi:hypothetical protein
MSSTLTVGKGSVISRKFISVGVSFIRTGSFDVSNNASACVIHEFDSDLRDASSRTYM